MSKWIRTDIENFEGVFPSKHIQPDCLSITIAFEPMKRNAFEYVVKNFMEHLFYDSNSFLTVGYQTAREEDNVSCIQTYIQDDGLYYLEIIKIFDDGIPYHSYSKCDVPFKDAVRYFKKVLVDYDCPDTDLWTDDTDYSRTK